MNWKKETKAQLAQKLVVADRFIYCLCQLLKPKEIEKAQRMCTTMLDNEFNSKENETEK